MKRLTLLLTLFAGAAAAAPNFHFRLGSGVMFQEDAGIETVAAGRHRAAGGLGMDYRLFGGWWIGADVEGGAKVGELHGREASFDTVALGLNGTWKLPLAHRLDGFGRFGLAARRLSFEYGDADGLAWTFSGRAGIGAEWSVFQGQSLGGGIRLEATYERAVPVNVVASGTSLGTFDASGPGGQLAFFMAF